MIRSTPLSARPKKLLARIAEEVVKSVMPKIKANGISIYYECHGQGEPLILIMGLRRNAECWYRQVPALSRHFQVVVFDNRGAGRSDQPDEGYAIALFAEDTAALMQGLGLPSQAFRRRLVVRLPGKKIKTLPVSTKDHSMGNYLSPASLEHAETTENISFKKSLRGRFFKASVISVCSVRACL
jgi:hypothetical protein